jgi:hypothetical protein
MKYKVKLRREGFEDGPLVADVTRVEWFGLKTTLIGCGVSASRIDYEFLIKHDYMQHIGGIEYDFFSGDGTVINRR